MRPNVLSIAGSDPSGGAGIQADIKSISANGGYAMAVIAALTAQNTKGVTGVHDVPPDFVKKQIDAIFDDIHVHALKTGMIGSVEIINIVVDTIRKYKPAHVVIDPVMVSQSGHALADDQTIAAIKNKLIPLATITTPNIPEAEKLLGRKYDGDMEDFARELLTLGCKSVLLKGGHDSGASSTDVYFDGNTFERLSTPRIDTKNNHGTGCTLASALATHLGKGLSGIEAAYAAKAYITGALKNANALHVGNGHGPVHHFWECADE